MSKVFTRRFRVRYSEIGADGWVNPANYLNYVVETAYDWGTANALGMQESEALGLAWVVRETSLEIFQPLAFNDEFDLSIWLMDWRKVRGTRGFKLVRIDSGKKIAQGAQKIISLDSDTMRPVTPPDGYMDKFQLEQPKRIPLKILPAPMEPEFDHYKSKRHVEWRDLDSLAMVYNSVYVSYAEDAIRSRYLAETGFDDRLKSDDLVLFMNKLQVKYLLPAKWNNLMEVTTQIYTINQAEILISFKILDGITKSVLTIIYTSWGVFDRKTREITHIPEYVFEKL